MPCFIFFLNLWYKNIECKSTYFILPKDTVKKNIAHPNLNLMIENRKYCLKIIHRRTNFKYNEMASSGPNGTARIRKGVDYLSLKRNNLQIYCNNRDIRSIF